MVKYVKIHIFSHFTWLSQKSRGWWRKTTYIFEFSVKSSIRIWYFPSCSKIKVKFCCLVKYVKIHIFSYFTWLSQKSRGWWRKTTYMFEFSVKSSIRIWYFLSCAKKSEILLPSEICKNTHFFHTSLGCHKKTVGDGEKLITYLNSALKALLGFYIFPRVPKKKWNFVA